MNKKVEANGSPERPSFGMTLRRSLYESLSRIPLFRTLIGLYNRLIPESLTSHPSKDEAQAAPSPAFLGLQGVRRWSLYIPGILFIAMAVVVVMAPRLVVTLLSVMFLFFGVFLMYGTYRLLKLKKAIDARLKGLQGRVFVQGVQMAPFSSGMFEDEGFDENDPELDEIAEELESRLAKSGEGEVTAEELKALLSKKILVH